MPPPSQFDILPDGKFEPQPLQASDREDIPLQDGTQADPKLHQRQTKHHNIDADEIQFAPAPVLPLVDRLDRPSERGQPTQQKFFSVPK